MRIALIQHNLRNLYDAGDPPSLAALEVLRGRSVEEVCSWIDEAGEGGARLVVTSETFNLCTLSSDSRVSPSFGAESEGGRLWSRLSRLALKHGLWLAAGLVLDRGGGIATNSCVLFGPEGEAAAVYDKVHLASGELAYRPGERFVVVPTEYGKLGLCICWDLQYPETARALTLMGADLIVCPTWGWEDIYGLCRAYENGIAIAAAMALPPGGIPSGQDPSSLVDPSGHILARGSREEAGVVMGELDPRARPPLQYGDEPTDAWPSMREQRLGLRRPEAYGILVEPNKAAAR
jgi:predicted amidohydrolase